MKESPLPSDIFYKPADEVARLLLGKRLIRHTEHGPVGGLITETEAYLPDNDPANHAARGKTVRNASMFLEAGHWYVYLVYGMHYCLNAVTGPQDSGEAVLIRAIIPTHGLSYIKANRPGMAHTNLTNGPAKLTKALSIDRSFDGTYIYTSSVFITQTEITPTTEHISITPRIGISQGTELPLRYVWSPDFS